MKSETKGELIARGAALADDLVHKWFVLGQLLVQIHRLAKTEDAFSDVCDQIGIGGRTGYYLLRLSRRLTQLELAPPADVSWRMLVETLPCLRRDNYEQLLAFCRAHTRDQLIAAVTTHAFD